MTFTMIIAHPVSLEVLSHSQLRRKGWAESRFPSELYITPSPQVAESSLGIWSSPRPYQFAPAESEVPVIWKRALVLALPPLQLFTPREAAGGGNTVGCKSFSSQVCSCPQVRQPCLCWNLDPGFIPDYDFAVDPNGSCSWRMGMGPRLRWMSWQAGKMRKKGSTMFCES